MIVITTDNAQYLLFMLKAQVKHGLTRKEAQMLWNDGIDTLYDHVETIKEQ